MNSDVLVPPPVNSVPRCGHFCHFTHRHIKASRSCGEDLAATLLLVPPQLSPPYPSPARCRHAREGRGPLSPSSQIRSAQGPSRLHEEPLPRTGVQRYPSPLPVPDPPLAAATPLLCLVPDPRRAGAESSFSSGGHLPASLSSPLLLRRLSHCLRAQQEETGSQTHRTAVGQGELHRTRWARAMWVSGRGLEEKPAMGRRSSGEVAAMLVNSQGTEVKEGAARLVMGWGRGRRRAPRRLPILLVDRAATPATTVRLHGSESSTSLHDDFW